MRLGDFEVQRYAKIGVNNVPVDSEVVVDKFKGRVVIRIEEVLDQDNTNNVNIDAEITSIDKLVNVQMNDIIRELGSDVKYRVIRTFPYPDIPRTRIWCSTNEQK